jgi:hypothetical protein
LGEIALRFTLIEVVMLLAIRSVVVFIVLNSLPFVPIAYVVDPISVLVHAKTMLLVSDVLAIVDMLLGLPLQTQSMFGPLVEILCLPASQVPPAVEMPYHTHIPCDQNCAVCVFFYDHVFVGYSQFLEHRDSSLIQVFFVLSFEYKLFYEKFWNFDYQMIGIKIN